jgi:hypothetical protein
MAQHRIWAAREDGRHPPALPGQALMANRVDAAVEAVKVASIDQPANVVTCETELQELPGCDRPMLPCSQRR